MKTEKSKWTIDRIKNASIGDLIAKYECIAETEKAIYAKSQKPEMFQFNALSIGDKDGQLCIIPLDESDKGAAELIVKALQAYRG